jgi:hypothetical protein
MLYQIVSTVLNSVLRADGITSIFQSSISSLMECGFVLSPVILASSIETNRSVRQPTEVNNLLSIHADYGVIADDFPRSDDVR